MLIHTEEEGWVNLTDKYYLASISTIQGICAYVLVRAKDQETALFKVEKKYRNCIVQIQETL